MGGDEIIKTQKDFNNIVINFKKYRKIKELGKGAGGTVYHVLNIEEKINYAIKQISIQNKTEEDIKKIEDEIEILSKISNNNHIVKYYDSCKSEDNNYFNILMEFCEGNSLRGFINKYKERKKLIDEKIISNFILDICLGIKEIHKNKIIHRDLKPENLFLTKDNRIKIGDFGISKQLSTNNPFARSGVGTFNYMAPEIILQNDYNYKVDIWAFGCIIYELFTLKACFEGVQIVINTNTINLGTIDTSKYNSKWQALIESILKRDYNERPSIEDIYLQIKEITEDIRISDLQVNKMKRISEKDFKNKILGNKQIYRMRCN